MKKIFGLCFLVVLVACSTPKNVSYFQEIEKFDKERFMELKRNYKTTILPGDLLNITVSAWDPSVVTPFNSPLHTYSKAVGSALSNDASTMFNYQVASDGTIKFPVLGDLLVQGKTRQELEAYLQERISKYVKDPLVNVLITNFKVTVLGEVTSPGVKRIYNDRVTVLEALGESGDLTINANRNNVLIVREVEGDLSYGVIDLTDANLFASPYYYLRQNDVVYVEPNKAKKKNARYSQAQQYNITVVSTILSAISVIASVVVALVSIKN